jgi:hypothetical protein
MAPRKADNCIVRCAGNEKGLRAGGSGYWRVECLDGCVFTSESSSMESDVLISVSNVRQRANVEVNCLGGCFVDIGRQQRLAHETTSFALASTERV